MKIKINFSFLFFCVLIPFFKTDYITNSFSIISNVFDFFKFLSVVSIIGFFLWNRRISKEFFLFMIFFAILILMTVIYHGDLKACVTYSVSCLSITYLIDSFKLNRKFISTLLFCFELVIYINFLTMLCFPKGMYSTGTLFTGIAFQNWFMGFKNVMVTYFLPAFIISNIYKNLTGNFKRHFFLVITILISTFLSGSTTTLIGIIILVIIEYLISVYDNIWKYLNLTNYIYLSVFLFVLVVLLRVQEKFQYLFVTLLNKDATFSNRTNLWDVTIQEFFNKPFLGHGWQNTAVRHIMYNSETVITAHNQYLEFLYLGGFLILFLFFTFLVVINIELKPYFYDKNVQIISTGFFVLQILGLTEVFLNPLMILVYVFLVYSKYFIIERC